MPVRKNINDDQHNAMVVIWRISCRFPLSASADFASIGGIVNGHSILRIHHGVPLPGMADGSGYFQLARSLQQQSISRSQTNVINTRHRPLHSNRVWVRPQQQISNPSSTGQSTTSKTTNDTDPQNRDPPPGTWADVINQTRETQRSQIEGLQKQGAIIQHDLQTALHRLDTLTAQCTKSDFEQKKHRTQVDERLQEQADKVKTLGENVSTSDERIRSLATM